MDLDHRDSARGRDRGPALDDDGGRARAARREEEASEQRTPTGTETAGAASASSSTDGSELTLTARSFPIDGDEIPWLSSYWLAGAGRGIAGAAPVASRLYAGAPVDPDFGTSAPLSVELADVGCPTWPGLCTVEGTFGLAVTLGEAAAVVVRQGQPERVDALGRAYEVHDLRSYVRSGDVDLVDDCTPGDSMTELGLLVAEAR